MIPFDLACFKGNYEIVLFLVASALKKDNEKLETKLENLENIVHPPPSAETPEQRKSRLDSAQDNKHHYGLESVKILLEWLLDSATRQDIREMIRDLNEPKNLKGDQEKKKQETEKEKQDREDLEKKERMKRKKEKEEREKNETKEQREIRIKAMLNLAWWYQRGNQVVGKFIPAAYRLHQEVLLLTSQEPAARSINFLKKFIHPKVAKIIVEQKRCPRIGTNWKLYPLKAFTCDTCSVNAKGEFVDGTVFCEYCALKCHKGHNVKKALVEGDLYCDCPEKCRDKHKKEDICKFYSDWVKEGQNSDIEFNAEEKKKRVDENKKTKNK